MWDKRMQEYSRMDFTQREILREGFNEIRKCAEGKKYCLENYVPINKMNLLRTLYDIKKEAELMIDIVMNMKVGKTRDVEISDSWERSTIFDDRVSKFKAGESYNIAKSIEKNGDVVKESLAILRGEK